MTKKILLGLLAVILIAQFIRPEKNDSDEHPHAMWDTYPVPAELMGILKVACNDCHSNITQYPWYSNIQPLGWWIADHIDHGKGHLNFSEFTQRRIAIQNHKFEEIIEMIKKGEMPLDDYTRMGMHPEANLSDAQKQLLLDWTKEQMDTLAARYPADSLILKRR